MEIKLQKQALRQKLKAQRASLSREQVARSSEQIVAQLLESEAYRKAQCIFAYLAFGKEVNVDGLLEHAWSVGKRIAVPLVISKTEMLAVELTSLADLELDRFGIRSVPAPHQVLDPSTLDLVLVPGLAFGRDGSRMGMGAGYYDRFLPLTKNAKKIGIAYEALLQDTLPCDEHDEFVPNIVSESGFIKKEE